MGKYFFVKFTIATLAYPIKDEDILWGNYELNQVAGFVVVDSFLAKRPVIYLHQETLKAFKKLHQAALAEGIDFRIVSGVRNFEDQKRIWERKIQSHGENEDKVLEVLRFSAFPGASRHHWGTDFDLTFNDIPPEKALVNTTWEQGMGKKAYLWLKEKAHLYGFCQPYQKPPNQRRAGYVYGHEEEKWHWSYKPRSLLFMRFLNNFQEIPVAKLPGSTIVKKYLREFLQNIHPDCL